MFSRFPTRQLLLAVSTGVMLTGCLTKGSLDPVHPYLPPGPTVVNPPMSVYALSGKVTGLRVLQVDALALSNHASYSAKVDEVHQTFQFGYLEPCNYQLTLVTATSSLVLQKAIRVEQGSPVTVKIEVYPEQPAKVLIDGLPVVAVEKALQ